MSHSAPGESGGFSLIEVMVSLLILTVGMAASIEMVRMGGKGIEFGRKMTQAVALGEETMEIMRLPGSGAMNTEALRLEEKVGDFMRETILLPAFPQAGLSTLRVEVRWSESPGKNRRVQLAAIRAQGVVP